MPSISFNFNDTNLTELDIRLLNNLLFRLKDQIANTSANCFRITYNIAALLRLYTREQIYNSLNNLFLMIIIRTNDGVRCKERLIVDIGYERDSNEIEVEFSNVQHLKNNFFIYGSGSNSGCRRR
ncbi:hypothetical protein [Clostridium guangxiense]|uniref:hypothetical protein n=1 Tax=Clostridium guangxiense TaxID=1662055 RepID=UPI001E613580|nr:hypothetical protein [Clostridium guangxiense]MCD2346223.1 hypothetical protein [Clostridium guangxiense]